MVLHKTYKGNKIYKIGKKEYIKHGGEMYEFNAPAGIRPKVKRKTVPRFNSNNFFGW